MEKYNLNIEKIYNTSATIACDICYEIGTNNILYHYCNDCQIYICRLCIEQLIKYNYIYCLQCKKQSDIHIKMKLKNIFNEVIYQYKNTYPKFEKNMLNFGIKKKPLYFDIIKINEDGDKILIHNILLQSTKNQLECYKLFNNCMIETTNEKKYVLNTYKHVKKVIDYLLKSK